MQNFPPVLSLLHRLGVGHFYFLTFATKKFGSFSLWSAERLPTKVEIFDIFGIETCMSCKLISQINSESNEQKKVSRTIHATICMKTKRNFTHQLRGQEILATNIIRVRLYVYVRWKKKKVDGSERHLCGC